MIPAYVAVVAVLRGRTAPPARSPTEKEFVAEEVRDEPWWAFNYYLGSLKSRIVVNADTLTTAADLVSLAAHEAYPGHHTEHAVKEQRPDPRPGKAGGTVPRLVPTPQALVSEGIAEAGLDFCAGAVNFQSIGEPGIQEGFNILQRC